MEFVEISLSSEVASSRLHCVSCGDSFGICAEDALQPFDWNFRTQFLYLQKKAKVLSLTYRLDDNRLSLSLSLSRVPGGFSLCFVSSIIKTWNSSQDEIVFLALDV
jgi:hypothetical protein